MFDSKVLYAFYHCALKSLTLAVNYILVSLLGDMENMPEQSKVHFIRVHAYQGDEAISS